MQDGGAGLVQKILGLAPVAHPRWPTAARMVLIHFGYNQTGRRGQTLAEGQTGLPHRGGPS